MFMLLLVTGCSVDYKVVIDSNYKVKEISKFIGQNDVILSYNDSIDLYLDSQIKSYQKITKFKSYTFDKKIKNSFSFIEMERKYPNIDVYIDSPILNQLFEMIDIEKKDGFLTFTTAGETYYDQYFDDNKKHEPEFFVDEINIKMRFHNEIVEHNADYFDITNNTLEWNISKNNQISKIYFKLGPTKKYDIILVDLIYENRITIGVLSFFIVGIYLVGKKVYHNHILNNSI